MSSVRTSSVIVIVSVRAVVRWLVAVGSRER